MIAKPREITVYKRLDGFSPFYDWLDGLDRQVKKQIISRLERVGLGNFGDSKRLNEEIYELRFFSGIRIYYGFLNDDVIVLILNGGGKKEQDQDIEKAGLYFLEFISRNENEAGEKNE